MTVLQRHRCVVLARQHGPEEANFSREMHRFVFKHPRLFGAGILLVWSAVTTQAQISPGPLARAHQELDTSSQCFTCHGGGLRSSGIDERCAECHTEIAWQKSNEAGLHGQERLETCSKCHPDHAGLDFELIEWAEGSADEFDHKRTGWPLSTPHGKLKCSQCHKPKFQTGHITELMKRKDPDSSWLGLDTDCAGCHEDVHHDTLGRDCNSCHAQGAWLPTRGFDHDRTQYPLDGKHVEVTCVKCHGAPKPDKRVYAPLAHQQCSACHDDVHRDSFGPDCSSCHSTAGFKVLSLDRFDHSKTRFPLSGKHRKVECSGCHDVSTGTYGKKVDFAACSSCHEDAHAGTARWEGLAVDCGVCHNERGFRPSTLTVSDHDKAEYKLEGAHRDAACQKCHTREPGHTGDWGKAGVLLQPTHASCTDCHAYPHADQLDQREDGGACESCHTVSGWTPSTFDLEAHHALEFDLTGAHVKAACRDCHGPQRTDLPPLPGRSELGSAGVALTRVETECAACHFDPHEPRLDGSCDSCHITAGFRPSSVNSEAHESFRYPLVGTHRTVPCFACHEDLTRAPRRIHLLRPDEGASLSLKSKAETCSACHTSPHMGQFAERESDCASCHDERSFVPALRFDHDAAFPLVGGHRNVACAGCHVRAVGADGAEYSVYAPVSQECESCHRKGTVQEIGELPQ